MNSGKRDITSFVLTRHSQRVYLTVFLDDYSRYIVSWGLYLHQKQDIVIETLLSGIERFGKPKEVLSDQGRQYFAWRGKSDFQKLLIREGIQHVVARTHHPQTVGKTERFWATVGEEFWERTQPQDLTEAKERFRHFVAHYNHFRPHQGIDGMVPADRFFGVEDQMREAMEKTMDRNELHLALGEEPRKPVYLVGQIGDQQVSMHGEKGRLIFQTQDGNLQEMGLEGLGAPGGKNGTGNTSRKPKQRKRQGAKSLKFKLPKIAPKPMKSLWDSASQEEKEKAHQAAAAILESWLGQASREEIAKKLGVPPLTSVADVPAGAGGAGGRIVETTQSQEGNQGGPAAGGGSGEAQETDRKPGEGLGDDERAGGVTEGISGPSGGEGDAEGDGKSGKKKKPEVPTGADKKNGPVAGETGQRFPRQPLAQPSGGE